MTSARPFAFALLGVCVAFVAVAPTSQVDAQIRASEPTTFSQSIDGTVFTMEYYRPRARGRSPLFGVEAVVWETTWTPGANWATWIEFQKPVTWNGTALEAGKYAIWMELDEGDMLPHELILEPYVKRFHTQPPPVADNQIRMPVVLTEGPHKELLTWEFEDILPTGGTLSMRWGTTRIAFEIGVEPSMRQTVTEEEAAPVVGMYSLVIMGPEGQESPEAMMEIALLDDDRLHADLEGVVTGEVGADAFFNSVDLMLLPLLDGVFMPGEAVNGELREVWADTFMEFRIVDGMVQSFEIRDQDDAVFMKGTRKH